MAAVGKVVACACSAGGGGFGKRRKRAVRSVHGLVTQWLERGLWLGVAYLRARNDAWRQNEDLVS